MTAIYALRSLLHMLFMAITVVPWALAVVLAAPLVGGARVYRMCAAWLATAVWAGGWILGIRNRVTGWENLPQGRLDAAVLLVKHQSVWETFSMPALMPRPLAFVLDRKSVV